MKKDNHGKYGNTGHPCIYGAIDKYQGYEGNNAKHYEACKYVASVINKKKYVLSPEEVQKRRDIAAKKRADEKAKKEVEAIAKAEAEAEQKARAEIQRKAAEAERIRVAPINAEIKMLSKELRGS